MTNGKRHQLGSFINAEDAAKARDKKAIELQGEFAFLNFPDFDYTNYEPRSDTHVPVSKYPGVTFSRGRWVARLQTDNKRVLLGSYDTEEKAMQAMEEARKGGEVNKVDNRKRAVIRVTKNCDGYIVRDEKTGKQRRLSGEDAQRIAGATENLEPLIEKAISDMTSDQRKIFFRKKGL